MNNCHSLFVRTTDEAIEEANKNEVLIGAVFGPLPIMIATKNDRIFLTLEQAKEVGRLAEAWK